VEDQSTMDPSQTVSHSCSPSTGLECNGQAM
jgi:hypothetical protein